MSACLGDQKIAALIGGAISNEERTIATTHLDTCDSCRELVAVAALARPTVNEKPRSGSGKPGSPKPAGPSASPRYLDHEEIARGGMGRVVEATDTVLGRKVAVKEALTTDPEALRRFAREIRLTARLEHPSIVPIYDTGFSADGSPFYVMRKVSGQPLEDLVAAADAVDQRLALLPHVVAAANAIAHAHQRGIVHRDLKPSNILVGDLGETVVIDWGLAKVIDEPDDDSPSTSMTDAGDSLRTRVGTVFGTPGFMSPEQLRGEPVDERSDVYALGATLYYVLARRPPHAGTSGTEMMGAAAKGPPQPVVELVSGVPPALAAIVDKALAYDDRVRYPNAGELVADLQRFLTGQLVACHHYTRRERFIRFVRRNRIAVGVVAAATLVVAVVIGISIARVLEAHARTNVALAAAIDERDAADLARERATERADELLLAQARVLVDTNPTGAVAMVKPLAASPLHWRAARDIGAAARTAGAAWGLPAPVRVTSLEISPDGTSALTAGTDGSLRIYDLPTHATRVLVGSGANTHATFAGNARIISYRDDELRSLDIAAGTSAEVVPNAAIEQAVATATDVIWIDQEGALWRTDVGLAPPHRIPFAGKPWNLSVSPDQRWVAVLAVDRLYVVELATERVSPIGDGRVGDVAWDSESPALSAVIGDAVVDVSLDGVPRIVQSFPTKVPMGIVRSGDRRFYIGTSPRGIMEHRPSATRYRGPGGGLLRLALARRDVLVSMEGAGELLVMADERELHLHSPIVSFLHIATSPHGHFVLAAGNGRLMIWDLDLLLPRSIEVPEMHGFDALDRDEVVIRAMEAPWMWIDLATGRSTPLPGITDVMAVLTTGPDPDRLLVVHDQRAHVFHRGDPAPITLDTPTAIALMLPESRVLAANAAGQIVVTDLATRTVSVLAEHASEPVYIGWAATWAMVQFADGFIWRRDFAGGISSTLSLGSDRTGELAVELMNDGRMVIYDGAEISIWFADGRRIHQATLPAPVASVHSISAELALVITVDQAGYAVDLARQDHVVSVLPAGTRLMSVAAKAQLVLAPGPDQADVVDLATGMRWPLGAGVRSDTAQLSRDASRVVQQLARDRLGVWQLQLPEQASEVPAWLETITNATAEHGPASVSWRD